MALENVRISLWGVKRVNWTVKSLLCRRFNGISVVFLMICFWRVDFQSRHLITVWRRLRIFLEVALHVICLLHATEAQLYSWSHGLLAQLDRVILLLLLIFRTQNDLIFAYHWRPFKHTYTFTPAFTFSRWSSIAWSELVLRLIWQSLYRGAHVYSLIIHVD